MTARGARRGLVIWALVAAACGGDERPSDAAWASEWEREQLVAPTFEDLTEGGRERCDELTGRLREALPRLTPTPSEALDAAVGAWIDHAETLVFECPDDLAEIERRIEELSVLRAAVEAGLAADRTGSD